MERSRAAMACVLVLMLAAVVVPDRGAAQASAQVPPILAGAWAHDGDVARGMHTVERAFSARLSALPSFLQRFAVDRIRGTLEPPRTIDVALTGGRVHVELHGNAPATMDGALGAPATTTGIEEGTTVTPSLSSGWLDLLYEGQASRMHQLFSTEPDGARMHVDYAIDSPQLGGLVRYRLEYVRAAH